MRRRTAKWVVAGAGSVAAVFAALAPSSAPYALVFFLAAVFAANLLVHNEVPISLHRLTRAVLLFTVAVGLLVPAAVGLIHASGAVIDELTNNAPAQARRDLALLTAVLALFVWAARRWPDRWRDAGFLAMAGLVVVSLKLVYVQMIQMEPYSDFGEMWWLASQIPVKGLENSLQELASHAPHQMLLEKIYLERILPYFLPLRWMFGPEPSSYQTSNVIVETAASLLIYSLAREWFGRPAARIAFVLSLLAVETWLAAEIPTHDIPGALYTVAGLCLFVQLCRLLKAGRWRLALFLGPLLGLVTLLIELQRTTGTFFLLSCGLVAIVAYVLEDRISKFPARRAARAFLLLIILPFAVFRSGRWALDAAGLTVPKEVLLPRRYMALAAGSESWSDGSWGRLHTDYELRYGSMTLNWYRMSLVRLASDTAYTPSARLTSYLRKSRDLLDLGSQTYFYLHDAKIPGGGVIDAARERRFLFISRCFTVFFLVSFLLGCRNFWQLPRTALLAWLPLFYLSLVSTVLILFSAVQPRYLFQLWYFGAIYAGIWLAGRPLSAFARAHEEVAVGDRQQIGEQRRLD